MEPLIKSVYATIFPVVSGILSSLIQDVLRANPPSRSTPHAEQPTISTTTAYTTTTQTNSTSTITTCITLTLSVTKYMSLCLIKLSTKQVERSKHRPARRHAQWESDVPNAPSSSAKNSRAPPCARWRQRRCQWCRMEYDYCMYLIDV